MLAVLAFALVAPAGVVQTRGERLVGVVAVREGALAVGERTLPAGEVLLAVFDAAGRTLRPPNTVRRTNGEVWHCEVLALARDKLTLRSPCFGTREIARGGVRALEFRPKLPAEEHLETDTLYRAFGEPLPGSLLWITREKIAVDSPLGAMALDREEATRFILARPPAGAPPAGGLDEVVLHDGSVLHGRVELDAGALRLSHRELGELFLDARAVRSLLRNPSGCTYLTDLALQPQAAPLLGEATAARTVEARPSGSADAGAGHIRCLRIQPTTTLSVSVPGKPAAARTFRATVEAPRGARGSVRLRVSAGGKALWEKTIDPAPTAPEAISVDLAGEAVTIDVGFEGPPRFPCGVVLGDPHIVER